MTDWRTGSGRSKKWGPLRAAIKWCYYRLRFLKPKNKKGSIRLIFSIVAVWRLFSHFRYPGKTKNIAQNCSAMSWDLFHCRLRISIMINLPELPYHWPKSTILALWGRSACWSVEMKDFQGFFRIESLPSIIKILRRPKI